MYYIHFGLGHFITLLLLTHTYTSHLTNIDFRYNKIKTTKRNENFKLNFFIQTRQYWRRHLVTNTFNLKIFLFMFC